MVKRNNRSYSPSVFGNNIIDKTVERRSCYGWGRVGSMSYKILKEEEELIEGYDDIINPMIKDLLYVFLVRRRKKIIDIYYGEEQAE